MNDYKRISYTDSFTVRTYDIDHQKRITIPALVKSMHEAAMQNVIHLNLSVWDLEPHHISWVLMRKQLHIKRFPILGESLKVHTQPAGFEKFFTYRDYKVFDQADELIAYSSSTWLLMNTQLRKMARIPDFILEMRPFMPPQEVCLERPLQKLPKFGTPQFTQSFEVGWHDLDFNQHLNNIYYTQWMLEAMPDHYLGERKLDRMDIIYRAEARWKEKIVAETEQISNDQFSHRLLRAADQKELALAQTFWS